jgi:hypothetical protein
MGLRTATTAIRAWNRSVTVAAGFGYAIDQWLVYGKAGGG